MTPIADFEQLTKGVLVFPPELNGSNRRPHPLDTVIRWATPRTWQAWSTVESADLWQVVALHVHLDPEGLDWRRLEDVADRETQQERSVATLFRRRLARAAEHLPTGNLASVPAADDAARSRVRFADYVEWARVYRIPLPAAFPGAHGAPPRAVPTPTGREASGTSESPRAAPAAKAPRAAGPAVAAKVTRKRSPAAPDGFMREPDVLAMVAFSAATLWRKVKDGTFVAPVKLSAGVTAWRRDDVRAWLEARPLAVKVRSTKRAQGSSA